jgi:hypothetical protein
MHHPQAPSLADREAIAIFQSGSDATVFVMTSHRGSTRPACRLYRCSILNSASGEPRVVWKY